MAASLSRPDPSSPASVAEAGFSTSRRGFNQDEVRAFLTSVAAELGRLQERERQLEAQLRAAENELTPTPQLDDETVASLLGEETLRVLQTARESASQIKVRAEEAAAKILNDANDEANRLRQEAELESARRRHDAASDAEAEVALAKQQGREMVNEARAYRERVLSDLERRTNLARQQIEDLVHGRDRLLQVFERARLVAVDVTSELQSIDGPAELVNLSPTTGPLPLMVPTPAGRTGGPPTVGNVDIDHEGVDGRHTDDLHEPDPAETGEAASGDDHDDDHDDDDHDHDHDDDRDGDRDDAARTTDVDDAADAETEPAADADADAAAAGRRRDANVVSLFRGRDPANQTADDVDTDADAIADGESAPSGDERSVDDIFERLRNETPIDPTHDVADTDDTDDTDEDVEVATDERDDDTDADRADTPFGRRDEALTPLIVSGARKLKRVLADEQNGVLDQLRQQRAVTSIDEIVPAVDEHAAVYTGALADELLDAAVLGAAEAGKHDSKTLRTTLRKGALDSANATVRDDLVRPLRTRLERAVADGAGDNEEITKRVRAVYREWKTQHIDDQLDDAFRFAYGGGLAAGVKPGTPLVWTIDPSESSCPDCEDNSLGGEVPAGDAFPTGHTMAPAHPGCRCLAVPTRQ